MHVVFPYLARWYSANWSRYHHLLTALARRGHQITVLQPPPRPGVRETNYWEVDGPPVPEIDLVDLRIPSSVWRTPLPLDRLFKKGLATLAARSALEQLVRRHPVDVLLLYNIPQVLLARAIKATVVVDVADDLLAMLAHETSPWAKPAVLPLASRALRDLLASADLVTTPSTVLAERLGGKVRVLPNGVDLGAIAGADGTAIRARYSPPILGFVGAFEYFVDFSLLLDVATQLQTCTFLLVGGGRQEPAVRAAARRRGLANVHFVAPVPYQQALDHMAALDVALIPFRPGPVTEAASPLKLFEYTALRKPIVSTPTAEICRIASDWVFFARTSTDWVTIVQALLRSPDQVTGKIDQACKTIAMQYQWDRLAVQWETFIRTAIDTTGHASKELHAV